MKKTLLLVFFISLTILGCSKTSKSIKELENKVNQNPNDMELNEKLMQAYLLEVEDIDKVIAIYEANEKFKDNVMMRIFYSTALCMKAGNSKKPAEQLKYVRKGMHAFDETISAFPEDARCYMWQAITYSNFPAMLGADEFVAAAINKAEVLHKNSSPELVDLELKELFNAACNLYINFKNEDYLKLSERLYTAYDLSKFDDCQKKLKKITGK